MNNTKEEKKRVLLLTDSLGCPREEIPVTSTWTHRIIEEFGDRFVFYTWCKHGLSIDVDGGVILEWTREIKPNIIICQVGIVDASRRALSRRELIWLNRMPKLISERVRNYISLNHYKLTRRRDIHYTSKGDFLSFLKKLLDCTGENLLYIPIMAGKAMDEKCFACQSDISEYNGLAQKLIPQGIEYLDFWKGIEKDDILLDDGHHLNMNGEAYLYKKVSETLLTFCGL